MKLDDHFNMYFGHVQGWYSDFISDYPDLAPGDGDDSDLMQFRHGSDGPSPKVSSPLERSVAVVALLKARSHLAAAQEASESSKAGDAWGYLLHAAKYMGEVMPVYDFTEIPKEVQAHISGLKIKAVQLLFAKHPEGGWSSRAKAFDAIHRDLSVFAEATYGKKLTAAKTSKNLAKPKRTYEVMTGRLNGWLDDPLFDAVVALFVAEPSTSSAGK